jgi:outer membrane receptor for ferrienterochelin and colicins
MTTHRPAERGKETQFSSEAKPFRSPNAHKRSFAAFREYGVALIIGFSSFVTAVPSADAQPASSTLEGAVRDQSGALVAGATVSVRAVDSALDRIVDTARDGTFRVTGLPSGRYSVVVAATGFAAASDELTVPSERPVAFVLVPAPVVEQVRVVSASRQDELRETLNTRVDVLTRSRIQDTGAQTVAEVLREIPGVMTRRGSEGAGAAGEQIQGLDSRQVLVLIDGQPIIGARGIKSGVVNLDRQSADRLERIEVVKGASSALYGSDAIGGVINLITRRAQSPLDVGASVSGGSNGDLNGIGEGGFIANGWSGFASLEQHQSDGFDLTPTTFDTTAAEFRRTDGFGRIEFSPQSELTITGLFSGYRNRSQGRSNGELGPQSDDFRDSTFNSGVTANWLATPLATVQVRGYHARYDEESTGTLLSDGSVSPGALDERLSRVDGSVSYVLGARQHVQAGLEYTRDEYAGINRLRNDSGEHVSTGVAWGQHRLTVGDRVTTTVGARVDRHSIFGTAFSPKAGVNVRLVENLYARASYGRGFRAPDVGQLYYRFFNPTNFYQVMGNENLDPEYANSLQVGAEALFFERRARFGVNVFRNDVRDLITSFNLGVITSQAQLDAVLAENGLEPSSTPVFGRQLFVYKNVQDAVTEGVELDGEVALRKNLSLAGAYTYLEARDDDSDLALTGRHPHQGHVRVAWNLDRIGLRANLRGTFYSAWINSRAASGVETLGKGFQLWDAFISQRIVQGLALFVAVDNLADNQDPNVGVQLPSGSPASILRPEVGRTARFGLRWNWSAK